MIEEVVHAWESRLLLFRHNFDHPAHRKLLIFLNSFSLKTRSRGLKHAAISRRSRDLVLFLAL